MTHMRARLRRWCAVLTVSILNLGQALAAGPASKWAQYEPDTREWFNNLHSGNGISCCSNSDGIRIDDVDYKQNPDGSYEVHVPADAAQPELLPDRWVHVDKEHVINPPDRGKHGIGYAVVWPYHYLPPEGQNGAYCFMPGYGA